MSRSKHTEAQIIAALKQVEAGGAQWMMWPGSVASARQRYIPGRRSSRWVAQLIALPPFKPEVKAPGGPHLNSSGVRVPMSRF